MNTFRCRFNLTFIVMSILTTATAQEVPASPPLYYELSSGTAADLLNKMKANKIPGLAAGIIKGNTFKQFCLGGAEIDAKGKVLKPVDADTLFHLASVSKMFTATLIMKLSQEGTLDLEHPIQDYVSFPNNFQEKGIKLQMLLNHSSSIQDNYSLAGNIERINGNPTPLNQFLQNYFNPHQTGQFYRWEPGQKSEYANFGIALAGDMAQNVTNTDFNELCKQKILHPLGMFDASFKWADVQSKKLAMPYQYSKNKYKALNHLYYADYPAGTLRCSLNEAGKFFSMFISSAQADTPILTKHSFEQMTTPKLSSPLTENTPGFGFGCFIFKDGSGKEVIMHDGSDPGTGALFLFRKVDGIGIIILTNTDYSDNFFTAAKSILLKAADQLQ